MTLTFFKFRLFQLSSLIVQEFRIEKILQFFMRLILLIGETGRGFLKARGRRFTDHKFAGIWE